MTTDDNPPKPKNRGGRPRRDVTGDPSRIRSIHDTGPTGLDEPALELKPPTPESFGVKRDIWTPKKVQSTAGKSPIQRTLAARKTAKTTADIAPVDASTVLARTGMVNPWDQRPGEPGEDYNRFLTFLRMGRARTIIGAYRAYSGDATLKNAPVTWSKVSARWDWADRASAFDAAQHKLALQKQMEALEGMHEQRAAFAVDFEKREYLAGLKMLQEGMDLMDDPSPQAKEAGARMVHRSSVMMRTALGMAGGRGVKPREIGDDGTGAGKMPVKPFSEMTTSELAAFKRLASAADAMERASARASQVIDIPADEMDIDDDVDGDDEDEDGGVGKP